MDGKTFTSSYNNSWKDYLQTHVLNWIHNYGPEWLNKSWNPRSMNANNSHPSEGSGESNSRSFVDSVYSTWNTSLTSNSLVNEKLYICSTNHMFVFGEDHSEISSCDYCLKPILNTQGVPYYQCHYCNYTCHEQCKQQVSMETTPEPVEIAGESGSSMEESPATKEQCIDGLIRVQMNLTGPINIVPGTRPPSTYDMVNKDDTLNRTLTSFYLPRDTINSLHVTIETTAQQVVSGLLKKFKVVDNPERYALYERDFEPDGVSKVKLRRLNSEERPLYMALNWTETQRNSKSFVLQENDMTDISWEAFSIPELQNFLRILDREQQEYEDQIRGKYENRRRRLYEAISKLPQYSNEAMNLCETSKVS